MRLIYILHNTLNQSQSNPNLTNLQINSKPLPQPLPIAHKQQRRRTQRQARKRKTTNAPPIPDFSEQPGSSERDKAADDAAEDGAGGNG